MVFLEAPRDSDIHIKRIEVYIIYEISVAIKKRRLIHMCRFKICMKFHLVSTKRDIQ